MLYSDQNTNKVYFSKLLEKNYAQLSIELFNILKKHNIHYELVSNTKDIWMRDYMPIQATQNKFIRYIHKPDYLVGYENLKTNPKDATNFLDENKIVDIGLNLDGGNIVRSTNKIICTDKIFKANSNLSRAKIIETLKSSLEIEDVIIIPEQPFDMTGHSDGLVRFINESTVMISPYQQEDKEFEEALIESLLMHDLKIVTLPAKGFYRERDGSIWIPYINYMQVGHLIILPVVGMHVDEEVLDFFHHCFTGCVIEFVDSSSIIEQGGALNCISWNINNDWSINDK